MRQILLGDVTAAARALVTAPPGDRARLIRLWLDQAHMAHAFHKRIGRPHPLWGNGSLMARALAAGPRAEPLPSDPDYLSALRLVIEALLDRRAPVA